MVSFRRGVELGADEIELDVHLSRDNELVVMHDHLVDRTTDGSGRVDEMSAADIQKLDAGSHFRDEFAGAGVPLLSEVLEWARGTVDLVIEIKGSLLPPPGIEERLVEEINRFSLQDHVMVISFHHDSVKRIKEIDSSIATGVIYTGRPVDPVAVAQSALADSIRFGWNYSHTDDVRAAHDAGLCVSCWTPNEPEQFAYVAETGVDSIASNFPDRLRTWLDSNGLGVGK